MDYSKVIELVKEAKRFIVSPDMVNDVHMKGQADFVTAVDIAISNFLKGELNKLCPNVGFFSEEESGELTDPTWILDPVDGTTNLVYGYNMSSVSLALYEGGRVVFGVVYNPFTDECFTAERGKGAYLNGKAISVKKREFAQSIIEFGAGSTRKNEADENFELAKDIFKECIDIRRICSSALAICFIAAGRIDGYFEKVLKPWDYAAASLILAEAGGKTTDYYGKELPMDGKSSTIASNGVIHEKLLEKISKHLLKG